MTNDAPRAPAEGAQARAASPHAEGRERLHEIIFEADTPAGKVFDVALLIAILSSVVVVSLETVDSIREKHAYALDAAEWTFTALFTVEYVLRLFAVRRPLRYAFSFFGVVDLLAIVPSFISLLGPSVDSLLVIRGLRLLRIFRVFKLARFVTEATALRRAFWEARAKIVVFVTTVLILVAIAGATMYLVEGPSHGFTSIPQSMYWAIVTMTTVGYGDIAPETPFGKFIAALIMVLGYSMIVVPTGILSAELVQQAQRPVTTQACRSCMREGHAPDAVHCKFCGDAL